MEPSQALPQSFGRYQVLRKLGEGGMGVVYLAQDTHLNRRVALKVPRFTSAMPSVIERFQREARSAAQLRHPNICPIYDIGQVDGTHYLSMPYMEGNSLADFLAAGRPFPQRTAAVLVRKLAHALHLAHAHGIVHRDLKPSNVLVDRQNNEPIIMDFGLASQVDQGEARLTRTGTIVGTPAYMSPEQIHGHVTPSCDIYSLGVILYQLVTCRLPYDGPSLAVLARVLTEVPPRPSTLRPDLDPQLEQMILRAMARRPEDRYPGMGNLVEALTAHLASAGNVTSAPVAIPASSSQRPTPVSSPPSHVPGSSAFQLPLPPSVEVPSPTVPTPANTPGQSGGFTRGGETLTAPSPPTSQVPQGKVTPLQGETTAPHSSRRGLYLLLGGGLVCGFLLLLGSIALVLALMPSNGNNPLRKDGPHNGTGAGNTPPPEVKNPRVRLEGIPGLESGLNFTVDGREYTPEELRNPISLPPGQRTLVRNQKGRLLDSYTFAVTPTPALQTIHIPTNAKRAVPPEPARPAGPIHVIDGHTYEIFEVVFSPDGRQGLSGGYDYTVRLWDVEKARQLKVTNDGIQSTVNCVRYAPDGKRAFAALQNGLVVVLDLSTGKKVGELKGHSQGVHDLALTPDGKYLLTASSDHRVGVWDLETQSATDFFTHTEAVFCVAVSPDGQLVASGGKDTSVRFWDLPKGKPHGAPRERHKGPVLGVAFSPDGKSLVSVGGYYTTEIHLWSMPEGKSQGESLTTDRNIVIRCVAFHPDSQHILVGDSAGNLQFWDTRTRKLLQTWSKHKGQVNSVAISPGGRRALSAGRDKRIWYWSLPGSE